MLVRVLQMIRALTKARRSPLDINLILTKKVPVFRAPIKEIPFAKKNYQIASGVGQGNQTRNS